MKKNKDIRRKMLWLAALFFPLALWIAPASAACSQGQVGDSLQKAFPGWRIVSLEDLRRDDQGLWAKEHPGDCPGIASGHFQSKTAQAFVLTVFKESDGGLQQMLLIANVTDGQYKISVLNGPQKVAYLSAVSRVPPGEYSASTGEKIKVRGDSILYEAIEAGSVLYYFEDGKYKSENLDE
jgi:hypothetical protein